MQVFFNLDKLVQRFLCFCFLIFFGLGHNVVMGSTLKINKMPVALARLPARKILISIPYKSEYTPEKKPIQLDVMVIPNFKPDESLEKDANLMGYTFLASPANGDLSSAAPYRTQKLSWGVVYEWNTPTKGSAFYSYVCRTKEDFCYRVGPYSLINLDWTGAKFINTK